jgi:hypothetical protein
MVPDPLNVIFPVGAEIDKTQDLKELFVFVCGCRQGDQYHNRTHSSARQKRVGGGTPVSGRILQLTRPKKPKCSKFFLLVLSQITEG